MLEVVKFADGDRLRQVAPALQAAVARLKIRRRRAARLPPVPAACAFDVGALVDWLGQTDAVDQVKTIDEAFRARV